MSIDDKVGRDPRVTMLALAVGWSKRELVGCLVLDVWPLCYDQESAVVSERIIDAAAAHPGFAQAMVECELASRDRSGKVRINGAAERIKYLDHKKKAGREGGLKSAESRAKSPKQRPSNGEADVKQTSSKTQAAGNPSVPDTVPDSAPDPDTAPDGVPVLPKPEPEPEPAAQAKERKAKIPADWKPSRSAANIAAERDAAERGIDLAAELNKLRDWAKGESAKKADWDATWRNWTRNARARPGVRLVETGLEAAMRIAEGG
jgi:hypothetical protein